MDKADEATNDVRPRVAKGPSIDALDRRLHLSPPAVHERVKRLKRQGAIRGVVARLDGVRVGRLPAAFVHIDTMGWGKGPDMLVLAELPEVEEMRTVTGETCVLLKVRTSGTQALEDLLARIYAIPGVKGTRSYIVLSSYVERGPQPA